MIKFLEQKYFLVPMVSLIEVKQNGIIKVYSGDGSFHQETECYIMPQGGREITPQYFETMLEDWYRMFRHTNRPINIEELVGDHKGG